VRLKLGHFGYGLALAALGTTGAHAEDGTNWTGFYAGVYAGYALDPEAAESTSFFAPNIPTGDGTLYYSESFERTRIDGAMAGLAAGYNRQFDNVVFGVEGAIFLGALGKTQSSATYQQYEEDGLFSIIDGTTNDEANIDWYSTLTGSFGVAFEQDWMVFLKAGAAVANVSTNSSIRLDADANDPDSLPDNLPIGVTTGSNTSSTLVAGATIGFGVEKKLGNNVTVGAEYAYVDFGEVTYQGAIAPPAGGSMITFPLSVHTVKAALKYHF
jgi:outer membrane immunogenic protein